MPNTTPCPENILAAIPWYPDGLTPDECGAVEAHAADCRDCRAELAFLRGDDDPAIELPDAEGVYARVLERIAAPGEDEVAVERPVVGLRAFSQRAARPVSIAAGLMVALASGMFTTGVIWAARVGPTYEPAAVIGEATAGRVHLEVLFRSEATAYEIGTALREVQGTLVSGPTPSGVYRVRLAPGVDAASALERLRGNGRGVATFAEAASG